jgi:hypothetical protein
MTRGGDPVDLLDLLDRLEEMVSEGRRVPIGGGVVLDRRRLLELVDNLRVAVPTAVREAHDLLDQRVQVLQAAEDEGLAIVARAQSEAAALVSSHAIAKSAEERARALIEEARKRGEDALEHTERQVQDRLDEVRKTAEGQMAEADRYALEILQRLETQLTAFAGSVRDAIETISRSPGVNLKEPAASGDAPSQPQG